MSWPAHLPLRHGTTRGGIVVNFGAVGGAAKLRSVAGALLTVVLTVAVLMMIISGITCALASANGPFQIATRARLGLWVACGARPSRARGRVGRLPP